MKSTLVYDKNNHPIFEGDTITFPNLDIMLEEGFYKYANIDKVVGKVRKIGNIVGTIIDIEFFSGDKQVATNEQIKNYLVEVKNKKEEEVLKHYQEKGLKLNEYSTQTLDSNKQSDVFIKNFIHVDTLIIESEYSLKEKKKHKNEPLKITLGEIEATENDSFLIEVSEDLKEKLLETHFLLYEEEYEYIGHFTHVLLKPKLNEKAHTFEAFPVDSNGNITLFRQVLDFEPYMKEARRLTQDRREALKKARKEGVLSQEELSKISSNNIDNFNKIKESLKNDSRFLLKEPVDHFFIGFLTNIERIKEFHDHGCKIKLFQS
tara:strand:- start:40219 stop:41175 length:957 start_codon:yes stop_codon:yes gene_type:complete